MGSLRSCDRFVSLLSLAALAACSSNPPGPFAPPTSTPNPSGYSAIYSFHATGGDGARPYATLIDSAGTLYGTTVAGGASSSCSGGCGTVFRVSTSGSERVMYDFGSYKHDGIVPYYGVIAIGGTLYGTTSAGGFGSFCQIDAGCGAVFSVDSSGREHIVYAFESHANDGITPLSNLVAIGSTLYGTTQTGGKANGGTLFSVDTAGHERIVYDFGSYPHDGLNPSGTLIAVDGTLYGTTQRGGNSNKGAAFSVTTTGSEQLLHSFGPRPDGETPRAGLAYFRGLLFGTTAAGGASGFGTVFDVSRAGAEQVVHSFGKGADGKNPQAELTAVSGSLYGTTTRGGTSSYGTIFSVTPKGSEQTLYSFQGGDGAYPFAGLLETGGVLYGATAYGGSGSSCGSAGVSGCGTIFRFVH